jgi:hypothetical protein
MSVAGIHATKFYEQVALERRVFTFLDDEDLLVFKVRDIEVVPFWSSASRLARVRAGHEKYRKYTTEELSLEQFLENTLSLLAEEGIHLGLNWSGARLVGYDSSVTDVRRNLEHWLNREK